MDSMIAVPSLGRFTESKEDDIIPGTVISRDGSLILNSGRDAAILKVVNKGDRPIQVFACLLDLVP